MQHRLGVLPTPGQAAVPLRSAPCRLGVRLIACVPASQVQPESSRIRQGPQLVQHSVLLKAALLQSVEKGQRGWQAWTGRQAGRRAMQAVLASGARLMGHCSMHLSAQQWLTQPAPYHDFSAFASDLLQTIQFPFSSSSLRHANRAGNNHCPEATCAGLQQTDAMHRAEGQA